jgi:hypothetical protein
VVIGGLVSSTILTLLVIPALYKWFGVPIEPEARLAERSIQDESNQVVYQTSQVVDSDLGIAQEGGHERHERK